MLWSYAINNYTKETIFTTQPRQVQILNVTNAKNIISINLRNVEMHRFIFDVKELKKITLDNVVLGDGFSLDEMLQNNPELEEINFEDLEGQKIIFNDEIWQNFKIKKININKVLAFDVLKLIEVQANNLTHLSILNIKISADDLYELDECFFV